MLAEYFLRLSGILLLYEEIYRAVVDIERGEDGIASRDVGSWARSMETVATAISMVKISRFIVFPRYR